MSLVLRAASIPRYQRARRIRGGTISEILVWSRKESILQDVLVCLHNINEYAEREVVDSCFWLWPSGSLRLSHQGC